MSLIAATLFAVAFLVSAYATLLTLAQKWPRIELVAAMQGMPTERIIHLGQVRHTGQRVRLSIVNELEVPTVQPAFKFPHLRAA